MNDLKLTDFIKLPVRSSVVYILDAEGNVVADVGGGPEESLKAAAVALNAANGIAGLESARLEAIEEAGFSLPIRIDEECPTELLDAHDAVVLRIRGWGRLKYLGEETAIKAQDLIAKAFVDALNGKGV